MPSFKKPGDAPALPYMVGYLIRFFSSINSSNLYPWAFSRDPTVFRRAKADGVYRLFSVMAIFR